MVQSINWPAIRTTARVLFGQPSLAVPHVDLRDIRDIDFARWAQGSHCLDACMAKTEAATSLSEQLLLQQQLQ